MPKVGVADANEQVEEEEAEEQTLNHQEVTAAKLPIFHEVGAFQPAEADAGSRENEEHKGDRAARDRYAKRADEPGEVSEQHKAQHAGQWITLIAQPGHGKTDDRIDQDAEQENEQIPEQEAKHRKAVLDRLVTEELRPGAAGLLPRKAQRRKQERLVAAGLFGREMDDIANVHRTQELLNLCGAEIRLFLKYEDLRVVIYREGLFGELVVRLPVKDAGNIDGWERFKDSDQLIAETAFEHPRASHVVSTR